MADSPESEGAGRHWWRRLEAGKERVDDMRVVLGAVHNERTNVCASSSPSPPDLARPRRVAAALRGHLEFGRHYGNWYMCASDSKAQVSLWSSRTCSVPSSFR